MLSTTTYDKEKDKKGLNPFDNNDIQKKILTPLDENIFQEYAR